jgi:tripartite-type tricarboxylate transporter receptor subunit TctC
MDNCSVSCRAAQSPFVDIVRRANVAPMRALLIALMAMVVVALSPGAADAQSTAYPNRPITLVVPFAPGGATDLVARVVAQSLQKELGQTVVVDNRPAAGGTVAIGNVAKASPDGYTLLLCGANLVINPHLRKNLRYDPLTDFAPVAMLADGPEIIAVSASLPVNNLKEFIAAVRAAPGAFNYGTPGVGTLPHLIGDHFARLIGAPMVHVPFKGSAAAMTEVAAGRVQMSIATQASVQPFADAGKAKLLAVASPRRLASLPDLPTTAEAGLPDYEFSNWFGVVAPAGTSPEIVNRLNAALQKMFLEPDNTAPLTKQGIIPVRESVEFFQAHLRRESQRWKEVVTAAGVSLE